jgi:integrase
MKLIDIAQEFTDLNIFNTYTQNKVLNVAKIFVERSEIEYFDQVSLKSIAQFKERTLIIAKPVTYNAYLRYLRIIADYAFSQNLITKNYFREVKLAPIGVVPHKTIESQTLQLAVEHLKIHSELYDPHWFWLTVVQCLYYTGMRRRQLVNLKLSDINFSEKTILLRYQGSKTMREWSIPLHDRLSFHIIDLIEKSEKILGKKLKKDDYIFQVCRLNPRYKPDRNGRMCGESITGFFKKLSRNTESRIGAHRLRHTLATALCNPTDDDSPPDLFTVQHILGHTSLQTTRGYVKTSMNRMSAALNRVM